MQNFYHLAQRFQNFSSEGVERVDILKWVKFWVFISGALYDLLWDDALYGLLWDDEWEAVGGGGEEWENFVNEPALDPSLLPISLLTVGCYPL